MLQAINVVHWNIVLKSQQNQAYPYLKSSQCSFIIKKIFTHKKTYQFYKGALLWNLRNFKNPFFTENLRWLLLKGLFRILSNVYSRVFVKIANYQSSKLQSKSMLPEYDFSKKLWFSKWNLSPIISRFP